MLFGHGVGDGEHVGLAGAVAEQEGQQHQPDEAQHPGQRGAGRHHRAGRDQPRGAARAWRLDARDRAGRGLRVGGAHLRHRSVPRRSCRSRSGGPDCGRPPRRSAVRTTAGRRASWGDLRGRAARARSLLTWRIRRAVVPIRTTPAATAMAQPVVPFWVTWTSMATGRPTLRPDSVCSCAVTGTVPLARAAHLRVRRVVAARPDRVLGDDVGDGEPLCVLGGEDQPHLDGVGVRVGVRGGQHVLDGDRELDPLLRRRADLAGAADHHPVAQHGVQSALLRIQPAALGGGLAAPGPAGRAGEQRRGWSPPRRRTPRADRRRLEAVAERSSPSPLGRVSSAARAAAG